MVELGLSFVAALSDSVHPCLQIFLGMGLGPSHQKKLGLSVAELLEIFLVFYGHVASFSHCRIFLSDL